MLRKILCLMTIYVSVVSCFDDVPIWSSYHFGTAHENHEELVIRTVMSDNNFYAHHNVKRWKSITLGKISYAVGLVEKGFLILQFKLSKNQKQFDLKSQEVTALDSTPTDLELFSYWDEELLKQEAVLLVALGDSSRRLLFYTIQNGLWERLWAWNIDTRLGRVHYFKLQDNKHRLLLLRDDLNDFNGYLYEFTLEDYTKRNYWLTQQLPLVYPAFSAAVNMFGSDVYLSIPQKERNSVIVYKLVKEKFRFYQNLISQNVTTVQSFKIGFKTFLAIDGEDAGIYRFSKKGIVWEEVEGLTMEDVNFWLPLPLKTYRDEVALIVQHKVHHDPHSSFHVELVQYDGRKFVLHEEILCVFYGETEFGLSCIVDDRVDNGLAGAAVILLKNTTGILVPHVQNSGLFVMGYGMQKLKSPVQKEVQMLKETKKKLQKMIDDQKSRISVIQSRLQYSVKANESVMVTAPWKVDTIAAPIVQQKLIDAIPAESQTVETVNIQILKDDILKIQSEIDYAKNHILHALGLNKRQHEFDELIISGELEVAGTSNIVTATTEKFNDEVVPDVFNDIVMKGNIQRILGHKTFTDIEMTDLHFDYFQEEDIRNRMSDPDAPVLIKGDIEFSKMVAVDENMLVKGLVNGVDLPAEVVEVHTRCEAPIQINDVEAVRARVLTLPAMANIKMARGDNLFGHVAYLETQKLEFPGNVTVGNINGEDFDTFIKSLCMTNINTHIPGDTVMAEHINVQTANITTLNRLKFPEEYVLQKSEYSVIRGNKLFEGPIFISHLTTDGAVNGMSTEDLVSLTRNQTLAGTFIFNNVEITENLNVKGELIMSSIQDIVTNALITETNNVTMKVHFKFLEVEGNVIVAKNFNGADFGEILNDVVYKGNQDATITAIKTFPAGFTVHGSIGIGSGAINTIPIPSFVTKNTEQAISLQTLNGTTSFENLLLGGLYGGFNITKLDEEVVKLIGDQYVGSTLVITNNDRDAVDFSATDMNVVDTLNRIPTEEYYFASGDSRIISSLLNFRTILAKSVYVEEDVSGELIDFSLKDFVERRLSYTKDQVVTAQYNVGHLVCQNLKANVMNGEPFERLFDFEHYSDMIANMMFKGQIKIKHLQVNGSAFVESINGIDVRGFFKESLWANHDNNFDSVVFQKNLMVEHISLKYLNDVNFQLLTDNLVLTTDRDPIVVDSFKVFAKGFHVNRMLNAETLNEVHVDHILTKTGAQKLVGPLNIYGKVRINSDSQIYGNLNDVPVQYLAKTFQIKDDWCTINDDMLLSRLAYIEKLEVDGFVNDEHLETHLSSIVYKSRAAKFIGKITFENSVEVQKNVAADFVNDKDFSEFVEDVVFVTRDDLIEGTATFTQPVSISTELTVETDIETQTLWGIDVNKWKKRALFLNGGHITATLQFERVTVQNNIFVDYINNISMEGIISLHEEQYINGTLKFYEIVPSEDVEVGNLVNGYKLLSEYTKTLFTNGNAQSVVQNVIFYGDVRARNRIIIVGLVNGKNISKAVTTFTYQNLTAAYNFVGNVTVDTLSLMGSINGIDVEDWRERSIELSSGNIQLVRDNWHVQGSTTFLQDILGRGLIGGYGIEELADNVMWTRTHKTTKDRKLSDDYVDICNSVNTLIDIVQKQVYLFKYLENLEMLEYSNPIEYLHHFKHNNQKYIVITEPRACVSHVLLWTSYKFVKVSEFESGGVSQIITVHDGDLVFLVVRHNENVNCTNEATSVWKFESQNFTQFQLLEKQDLLHDSLSPGTFYGIANNQVVEFKIITLVESNVKRYKIWKVNVENLVFVPRGLATGLAVTDGQNIYKLIKNDFVEEDEVYFEDANIIGVFLQGRGTPVLSGRPGNEILVMNVGVGENRKTFFVSASHQETIVKGRLDFITIYENIFPGTIFHKVPSYKPSSLLTLEFQDTGETLLIFLEDEKTLQVYEYRGVEGFKHHSSTKLEASKLISFTLWIKGEFTKVLAAINKNKVRLIMAVTMGNKVKLKKPVCFL